MFFFQISTIKKWCFRLFVKNILQDTVFLAEIFIRARPSSNFNFYFWTYGFSILKNKREFAFFIVLFTKILSWNYRFSFFSKINFRFIFSEKFTQRINILQILPKNNQILHFCKNSKFFHFSEKNPNSSVFQKKIIAVIFSC
jgi:hypothetical protein